MGTILRRVAIVVTVLALVSCGGDTADTEGPATEPAPTAAPATDPPATDAPTATTEAPAATSAPETEAPTTTGVVSGIIELFIGAEDSEGFSTSKLEAKVGQISVTFKNEDEGGEPHNWHVTIGDEEYATLIKQGPDTQTVTFTVGTPGEYSFLCDTHPTAMRGTLVVTP